MEVKISAEHNGDSVLFTTLTFPDKLEGLNVACMLEALARNHWRSTVDEMFWKCMVAKP